VHLVDWPNSVVGTRGDRPRVPRDINGAGPKRVPGPGRGGHHSEGSLESACAGKWEVRIIRLIPGEVEEGKLGRP